ncbi:hypothetical protein BH11ACT3_BH11ACT3_23730 [soil metagenome]
MQRSRIAGRHRAPDVAAAVLGDATDCFWLDSGDDGVSYLGFGEAWTPAAAVLPALRAELAETAMDSVDGLPLGLVGWLPYELLGETMDVAVREHPLASFLRVRRLVAVHPDGGVEVVSTGDRSDSGDASDEAWRDSVVARLAAPLVTRSAVTPQHRPLEWATADAEYVDLVRQCQDAIRAGDAYVLNLTTEARVAGRFDPVATYARLRSATPAHHGGLIRIGGRSLVSSSPEQFLSVSREGLVSTSPVKGTRGRATDPATDLAVAAELGSSDKERAENVMIVDLMRNDLARVSDFDDVAVTSLFRIETLPRIHQLVSSLEARLRPGLTVVDAIAACFPAGSMTGAPKASAVQILDRLEHRTRGLYAGAFGYLARDGSADLAMTIRTIVLDESGASISVGGGITALSEPAAELAEIKLKAAPMIAALLPDQSATP